MHIHIHIYIKQNETTSSILSLAMCYTGYLLYRYKSTNTDAEGGRTRRPLRFSRLLCASGWC